MSLTVVVSVALSVIVLQIGLYLYFLFGLSSPSVPESVLMLCTKHAEITWVADLRLQILCTKSVMSSTEVKRALTSFFSWT
jgi:hypothetical protein